MLELYLIISIPIGCVVTFDGYVLLKCNGKVNKISAVTSTIEFIWVLISFGAVLKLSFSNYQILVPLLYLTHNVLGWLYAAVFMKIDQDKPMDIEIPIWYVWFGLSVGIVFSISSITALLYVFS